MKIDELGFYLQANGCIIDIVEIDEDDNNDGVYHNRQKAFYPNGQYYNDEQCSQDIIAHIPPALHYEIIRIIEAYHQGDSFKSIIDNCYKNPLEKKEK